MKFFRAVKEGFTRYFSVEGVASRRDFWFWIAFVVLSLCFALIIDGALLGPMLSRALGYEDVLAFDQDAAQPLTIALLVIFAIPTITVAVRRMHDSEKPGWWLLIGATIIGLIPVLYYLVKGGKKGENRFNT